jgi:excisionase family DNA binding protein
MNATMSAAPTTATVTELPRLITAREAAAIFRCSAKTIYRWISEGHIPESAVIRIGYRTIRLDRHELERVIEANGELRRWASRAA